MYIDFNSPAVARRSRRPRSERNGMPPELRRGIGRGVSINGDLLDMSGATQSPICENLEVAGIVILA